MRNKKTLTIIILLSICIAILIFPLIFIRDSEFGGADAAAEDAVTLIDPEYEPWAESIISPPGGETESLLFCLQAALGAGVIGYGFGYFSARNKYSHEENK